jgi:predicted RNase H-like nuclease
MSVLGIDGCKAGWCYYWIENTKHRFGITDKLVSIHELITEVEHVFIDMPIGLLDDGLRERDCDIGARKMLSDRRKSSVFRVPVRDAVYASTYEEASHINFQRTGKKLSKQSWFLSAKIRELDEYLRLQSELIKQVHEAHPELCFEGLAGSALDHRKAIREGFKERLNLLRQFEPLTEPCIASAWLNHGGYELQRDDILDACILALSARHLIHCRLLPEQAPLDRYGLPMQISYLAHNPTDITA